MEQVMVTLSRLLGNCYVWLLGYQGIADSIIINCLIVINLMNDFVMLFHWVDFWVSQNLEYLQDFFTFSCLAVFLSAIECHRQVSNRKSDIYLRLLHAGAFDVAR